MILFEAIEICSVEQGSFRSRSWGVVAHELAECERLEEAYGPLEVEGLHADDFMVRAGLVSLEDTAQIPYLVTDYDRGSGTIVPSGMVQRNPREYVSFDLARKLRSLSEQAMADLSLEGLAGYLSLPYPFRKK